MKAVDYVRNTKMDTVYGTKKYFQSLSGASDIYRTPACRAVSNDYTYQNTLGRRSTLGAYYHMNKQPSFTNDHSLNSQYGYNAWGIWRDGRNIAPSTFSAKTHTHYQKPRSFSIILTTAVFIVLLAVISIAGLAFYFSSVKSNLEDPVLGFEGSFRIAKGDLFSTGLKYNHTTTYKQKIEFYKRFIERSLMDNGLQPLRVDTWGFGEGPLIKVSFRTFLDVRKLPQNIHSVEDYIKESLFLETSAAKSLYRSLRIDSESVEIKRILDESVVRSASLFKDTAQPPTSQSQLEKRLMKKPNTPSLLSKPASSAKPRTTHRPHSVDDEPDVDVENAPVIQGSFEGSFEITKTDADIARKKVTPTKAYTSLAPKAVTPFALRVKPKKPSIEKLTTVIPQQQAPTTMTTTTTTAAASSSTSTSTKGANAKKTTQASTSTAASTSTTTTSSSTTTTTTTTTTKEASSEASSSTTTTTTTPRPPTTTETKSKTATTTTATKTTKTTNPTASTTASNHQLTYQPPTVFAPKQQFSLPPMTTPSITLTVPKLDANLFTSVPVLDTQPWRPIHREVPELLPGPPPAFPTKALIGVDKPVPPPPAYRPDMPIRRNDEIELPFIPENPSPPTPPAYNPYAPSFFGSAVRKPGVSAEVPTNPQEMVFYHSFGNPVFMPGTEDIERLGAGAHVKPHPLPVPLIDEVMVPPFKPLIPDMEEIPVADEEKFEHLGGGVIVKKHELEAVKGEEKSKPNVDALASESETDQPTSTEKTKVVSMSSTTFRPKLSTPNINRIESSANSELADTIGEFFVKLLNLPKEDARNVTKPVEQPIESRLEPEEQTSEETATEEVMKAEDGEKTEEAGETSAGAENAEEVAENIEEREEGLSTAQTAEGESEQAQTLEKPASEVAEAEVGTTVKPTFLNLKELILKRNQAKNQTRNIENNITGRPTPTTAATSTTTHTPSSTSVRLRNESSTNKSPSGSNWQRIRPSHNHNQKPPTILDDSNLFPSQSKWEFVNSSASNGFGHTGNMRKVFNKTLQAWISEDVGSSNGGSSSSGNTEDKFTLNDIKTRINNATNIQDISLIFDTLASKLGITPHVPTKVPPFSHSKLKHPSAVVAGAATAVETADGNSRNRLPTTTSTATTTTTPTTVQPSAAIRDKLTTIQWLPTIRRGTITAVPASATKRPWMATTTAGSTSPATTTTMPTWTRTRPTSASSTIRERAKTKSTTAAAIPQQPTTTTTTTAAATQDYIELPLERRDSPPPPPPPPSFIKPIATFMEDTSSSSEGIGAAIPVVGEAEVEVIDPNKYEEMLKSSHFAMDITTETAPQLVTLLPVRSNSGIRTYRPSLEEDDELVLAEGEARSNDKLPMAEVEVEGTGQVEVVPEAQLGEALVAGVAEVADDDVAAGRGVAIVEPAAVPQPAAAPPAPSIKSTKPSTVITSSRRSSGTIGGGFFAGIRRKSDINQARRFPPAEAIVKGGLHVKVK